ncbi:substrate-binding domain-containing protein [Marinomonas sp. THO17]
MGFTASLADQVLTEQAFFQLQPQQSPLSEQFTALVNSPPNPLRVSQQEAIRVVFLLFGERDTWQNQLILSAFRKRMRELGIVYRLDTYLDRSGSGVDFIPHLDVMVAESDYIVATKMSLGLKRLYERFLLAEKSKLILFDFAAPLRHWVLEPPLIYLGFDQAKAVQQLASYLDRQLPEQAMISALVLPDDYIGQMRCDHFIDEMQSHGRSITDIYVVNNDQQQAFLRAQSLLTGNVPSEFIFSCTQNIAKGVIQALQAHSSLEVQTNVWGPFNDNVSDIKTPYINAITLFYWDDVVIAIAEAIKLDLEGRNSANLYMARSSLLPGDIDRETLSLMLQQAYHYSVKSWR